MSTHMSPEALDQQNPFIVVRLAAKLSQKELAEEAGVSTPYVYRQERGLINTPVGSISDILDLYMVEPHIREAMREWSMNMGVPFYNTTTVDDLYYTWVSAKRAMAVEARIFSYQNMLYNMNDNRLPAVMTNAVSIFNRAHGSDYEISQQSFSRILAMHPRNWQLFAKRLDRAGNNDIVPVPETFGLVLRECGASQHFIDFLEGRIK